MKYRYCPECIQSYPTTRFFLCKGVMVCDNCFMNITRGNTIFFNEDKYPRKTDMFDNIIR